VSGAEDRAAAAGPAAPAAPNPLRLVLTLAAAGLLSGLAIAGIYQVTLPRITANKAEAMRRAVFEVLPGAERLQRLVWTDGGLVPAEKGEPSVYSAYGSDGAFVGYAVPAEGAGFQDNIKLIYGYLPGEHRIVGMRVLESRETPGLGDRIIKDQAFVNQFRDLSVQPSIVLVKGKGTQENDVDAITGATISSTAVVKILNAAVTAWASRLPAPGQEPPAPAAGAAPGKTPATDSPETAAPPAGEGGS
jgi:electron transport complex protein RnfG